MSDFLLLCAVSVFERAKELLQLKNFSRSQLLLSAFNPYCLCVKGSSKSMACQVDNGHVLNVAW
jgi:hypothetical protein